MAIFAEAPNWGWIIAGFVVIPILIAMNGFFVAAEFALVAVRYTRIEELVKQGVTRAKAVQDAISNLDRSIAATQLGITLASIALGWIGEHALQFMLAPLFDQFPDKIAFLTRHAFSTVVAFTLITFMHVVFGELIPKAIALQTPDRTSLLISPPLNLFSWFSQPVIFVMNGVANRLIRQLGYMPSGEGDEVHSIEELRLLIEDTEEAGLIDADAADVLMNVFSLSDKKVRDVMVPWDKVMSLELTSSPEKILEAVREGAHTRMPVYRETPDSIVGIVNTKDLFYLFSLRGIIVLEDAIYPAQYLGPDTPVSTALRLFRRSHRPMALIREPGSDKTLGILTLEDVLEEIVGDIEDEHDEPLSRVRLAQFSRALHRSRLLPKIPPATDKRPPT